MNAAATLQDSSVKTTVYADLLAHLLPTTKDDYIPHQKQLRFHYALLDCDVVLFNGGRGSGKTTSGAIQAIAEAEFAVSRGVIVAPTYPMLRDATMAEFFKWLPRERIADWHKTDKLLTLKNGSEIAFRSADNPDSLRGANRDWLWFDEPRNVRTREAFDVVFAQLRPHRKAWLTTTPAGIFHWLYGLFIEKPIPNSRVIVVRTSENPYLPEDYANSLRQQYTGAFAAQELDAQWVSFEGLIYDNFSLSENVSHDAEYNPALPVIWGVDDGYAVGQGRGTESYHPRVVLVMQATAQGGMNVIAEYVACGELEEITLEAALKLPYPPPEIVYIDSSAAQLKTRIWNKGIQTFGATHQVSEGIKNVRRLVGDDNGVRLLKIHPRCVELIREMQSYRRNPNTSLVKNGEVAPLKMDDHCFVAGTLIDTNRGKVAVEDLSAGDCVLTRDGYQVITACGQTDIADVTTVTFNNTYTLTGTINHPVYTVNRGFVPLREVGINDIILVSNSIKDTSSCPRELYQELTLLSTMELHSAATLTQRIGQIATTSVQTVFTFARGSNIFTAKSGRQSAAQSLLDTIFTTLTKIHQTIQSQISNVLQGMSTASYMLRLCLNPANKSYVSAWTLYAPWLSNGIHHQKGANGTNSKPLMQWGSQNEIQLITIANNAENCFSQPSPQISAFAPTIASLRIGVNQALTMKRGNAPTVGKTLPVINTCPPAIAAVRVASVTSEKHSEPQAVYNLSVNAVPEYFANGVLVHNCLDALRYALWKLRY